MSSSSLVYLEVQRYGFTTRRQHRDENELDPLTAAEVIDHS
jgi:hypothetical protein